jgi:putative hydrolase of the HAD superfamily
MIRGVTFDLWGTLIMNSKAYDHRIRSKREELLYAAVEGKVSREELSKALKDSWTHIQSVRSTLRDVPTSEQVSLLQTQLGVTANLEKPYTEAVFCELPEINPYAKDVLSQLETKIGLISNTGRTPGNVLRRLLDSMEIFEVFDVTVFSNEVGYLKPHLRIFEQASKGLGVPLSDILHVGDDVITDIEGGCAAGMHTLHVKEPHDLQRVTELV